MNGPAVNGAAMNGAAVNGPAMNGAAVNGATVNGPVGNGREYTGKHRRPGAGLPLRVSTASTAQGIRTGASGPNSKPVPVTAQRADTGPWPEAGPWADAG
jgi:hypothetical protein